MKKGQSVEQVIVYILAFIVTAAIVFLGYRGIGMILDNQCRIELLKFQDDFRQIVEDASYSYGSSQRMNLQIPCKYTEICIIDKTLTPGSSSLNAKNKVLYNEWRDKSGKDNVFLLKAGSLTPTSFYAGNISVDGDGSGEDDRGEVTGNAGGNQGFICAKTAGTTLNLIVEGRGRHSMIRK